MKRFIWVLKMRMWWFFMYGVCPYHWSETYKLYDERIWGLKYLEGNTDERAYLE